MYIDNRSYIEKEVVTKYKLPKLTNKVFDSHKEAIDYLKGLGTEIKTNIDEPGILPPGTIVYTSDVNLISQHTVEFSYFKYGNAEEKWRDLRYCLKNTKTGEISVVGADWITSDWKDWLDFEV